MDDVHGDDAAGRQDRRALQRRLPDAKSARPEALHRAQVLQARRAGRNGGGDGAQARGVRVVLARRGRPRQRSPRRRQRRRLSQTRSLRRPSVRHADRDARRERGQDAAAPRAADTRGISPRRRRQQRRSRGDVHQAHAASSRQRVPHRAAPIEGSESARRGRQLRVRRRRDARAGRGARDVPRGERRGWGRRGRGGRRAGRRGAVHPDATAGGDAGRGRGSKRKRSADVGAKRPAPTSLVPVRHRRGRRRWHEQHSWRRRIEGGSEGGRKHSCGHRRGFGQRKR